MKNLLTRFKKNKVVERKSVVKDTQKKYYEDFLASCQREKDMQKKLYEDFLSSCQSNGTKIIKVEMVDETKFYDTTWEVTFLEADKKSMESVKIVRYDSESLKGICAALQRLQIFDRDSILSLDLREHIYYD